MCLPLKSPPDYWKYLWGRGQRPQRAFEEDEAEEATKKKSNQINLTKFYFYHFFLIAPQKGAQEDAFYILSALKVFLKRMKQKRPLKVHPPNVGWGTLILFNSIDCGKLSFQLQKIYCVEMKAKDYSFLTS